MRIFRVWLPIGEIESGFTANDKSFRLHNTSKGRRDQRDRGVFFWVRIVHSLLCRGCHRAHRGENLIQTKPGTFQEAAPSRLFYVCVRPSLCDRHVVYRDVSGVGFCSASIPHSVFRRTVSEADAITAREKTRRNPIEPRSGVFDDGSFDLRFLGMDG